MGCRLGDGPCLAALQERTEEVRLGELLDVLEPDRRVVEEALAEILRDFAAMVDTHGG